MYQPANPLQSLSSILGIQQQRQQLQLQAQELQRSQVQTAQATGTNQFFTSWTPGDHYGADGTIDIDSAHQSPQYQALPGVAKLAVDSQLNSMKADQLKNKVTLSSLNNDVVGQWGRLAQSLKGQDPQMVQNQVADFAKQGPDQSRIAGIYGPRIAAVAQSQPQHLDAVLTGFGAQAQDVSAQQTQTNPEVTPISTGGATQIYNVNKATGLQPGQTPVASVKNTLAPAQQIPYVAAAAAAGAGGTARGGGSGNADIDTSNQVVSAQQQARANIDLTKRIDQLAEVVAPGALEQKVSSGLGALGLQNVNQARTEYQKDLGILQARMTARSGSDERARTVLSGLPSDTTPTQTVHQAMDLARGTARQDLALGAIREKTAAATGGQMNGFQGQYAHATGAASPLMHEYWSLPPADQVGFFSRNFNSKAAAKTWRDHADAVRKMSPDVAGQ